MKFAKGLFLSLVVFTLAFRPSLATVFKQETIINRVDIPASYSVAVSARIGGYLFDIEGLTSPWAKVEFSSTQGNVNLSTIADNKGIFRFASALMPLQTGDFCFISIDTNQTASPPLCFAPPPPSTKTIVRGIILPPSLTIDKNIYRQGEENSAKGKTAPNSEIKVFLFEEENPPLIELLDAFIPKVFAREGPALTVTSDEKGSFTFNLPSFKSTAWRVFVGTQKTQFGENPSPQSNILRFASLSWWLWLLLTIISWILKILILAFFFLTKPEVIIATLLAAIGGLAHLLRKRKIAQPCPDRDTER